jgi:hypothetical protein
MLIVSGLIEIATIDLFLDQELNVGGCHQSGINGVLQNQEAIVVFRHVPIGMVEVAKSFQATGKVFILLVIGTIVVQHCNINEMFGDLLNLLIAVYHRPTNGIIEVLQIVAASVYHHFQSGIDVGQYRWEAMIGILEVHRQIIEATVDQLHKSIEEEMITDTKDRMTHVVDLQLTTTTTVVEVIEDLPELLFHQYETNVDLVLRVIVEDNSNSVITDRFFLLNLL